MMPTSSTMSTTGTKIILSHWFAITHTLGKVHAFGYSGNKCDFTTYMMMLICTLLDLRDNG
jgi:hypothetical protein